MEYESNQMSPVSFALAHLYWGGLLYFFFVARLFGRLKLPGAEEPLSAAVSQWLLLAITAVCILLGFLSALKDDRNELRVAFNVLTPYGIYLVLKAVPQGPIYLWITAIICAGMILLYAVILFSAPIHRKRNRASVLKRRFRRLMSAAWLLSKTMLCLFAAVAIAGAVFGFSAIRPIETRSYIKTAQDLGAVDLWEEPLQGLREERWAESTLQERVDLMQIVADIEAAFLGLPDPLQVSCQSTRPNNLGFYAHETRSLCISRDHLLYDPPNECLDTVLHEVYHSYQHYLCALYEEADSDYRSLAFFWAARIYMDEFENYNRGEGDYMDYYFQNCESDAREYARNRSAVYEDLLFSAREETTKGDQT